MSLYEVCVHGWHNKLGGAEDRANFRTVCMLFSLAIGSYFSPYSQYQCLVRGIIFSRV